MVDITTIILFFVYTWGLGFSATYFVRNSDNFLERNLMNLGIGMGVFAILSVIINFLRIPLDWKIFLLLSIIIPIYDLGIRIKQKKLRMPKFTFTKRELTILLVLVIFFASFYVYTKGAFNYPYLEDEDPWGHSVGIKYVAMEKDAYDPELENVRELDPVLSYVDLYPPAYDVFLGILHQTSDDLPWTMKFFNALIISLGFIFFYIFVRYFSGNRNKALFATFTLAVIPCYLSHFIWAHSMVITLFFPTMYAFEKIKEDKRWWIVATLMVAGVWVTQNMSQPMKISSMLLVYLIVKTITHRKFLYYHFSALFSGILLSFVWWGAMIQKYGLRLFLSYYDASYATVDTAASVATSAAAASNKWSLFAFIQRILDPGGSAARAYTFTDIFSSQSQNMINAPIGIGIYLSLLTLIGVIFVLWKYRQRIVEEKNTWIIVSLFWLIYGYWGINGVTFPVSIARGSFRVWFLLAIPIAILSAEGLTFLKALTKSKLLKSIIVIVVLVGLLSTSAQHKYDANTSIWPTGGAFQGNIQEAMNYGAWFNSVPPNSKVFLFANWDKIVIGFGGFSCRWCQEIIDFRVKLLDRDATEIHSFLKSQDYEYFVLNGRMDLRTFKRDYGDDTEQLLQKKYSEILNSGLFTPVHQVENQFIVLRLK